MPLNGIMKHLGIQKLLLIRNKYSWDKFCFFFLFPFLLFYN